MCVDGRSRACKCRIGVLSLLASPTLRTLLLGTLSVPALPALCPMGYRRHLGTVAPLWSATIRSHTCCELSPHSSCNAGGSHLQRCRTPGRTSISSYQLCTCCSISGFHALSCPRSVSGPCNLSTRTPAAWVFRPWGAYIRILREALSDLGGRHKVPFAPHTGLAPRCFPVVLRGHSCRPFACLCGTEDISILPPLRGRPVA